MTLSNAYALLGGSKEDSDTEIKKKYHKLAMQYHPDKHTGGDIEFATKKMQTINAAYECIIQSRANGSNDFDWGLSVTVTYKRPPRPKGRTNPNANIARTTFGYHCDFWNLWKPKEESGAEFCTSLYRGIQQRIEKIKSEYDLLFFDPIVDRITYYGAAEYVDPYSALCERFGTTDISDSVCLLIITKENVNISQGNPVTLVFDHSLLVQPYAISFYSLDGKKIGTVRSMESVCVSLIKEHLGANITGTVDSIKTWDEFDFSVKKRVPMNYIRVRLHISFDTKPDIPFGFVNNWQQIDDLLGIYLDYSKCTENFFKGKRFGNGDIKAIYHDLFAKVNKPEIKEAPIYTLDYRVYERDAHEIDGKSWCADLTKIPLLSQQEKELLLYIYGASRKFDLLKMVSNSKSTFYQYIGATARFIIRIYRQKNPNYENGSDIKYWHNVRISIYLKETES